MRSFGTPAVLAMSAILIAGSACLGNEREAQPQKKAPPAKAPAPAPATAAAPAPGPPADVYRSILYPDGMQLRRSMETEKLETPSFHFVAAAKLPQPDRSIVLYAEEIGPATSDHEHYVFVASVDDRAKRVLDHVSLNDVLPLRLDWPAQFKALDGAITPLDVPAQTIVDVTTTTRLSGTGGITAISDFFFDVESNGKLTPVLQLPLAGGHSRSGWRLAQSSSSDLFVAPSGDEIAVQSWTITQTLAQPDGPASEQCEAKGPTLYRLEGKTFVAQETAKGIHTEAMKPIPRPSFATVRRCTAASR